MNHADRLRLVDADFETIGDQRQSDRRRSDRRTPRLRLDPLFAASLVNHVAPPERSMARYAPAPDRIRPGIAFDLKA